MLNFCMDSERRLLWEGYLIFDPSRTGSFFPEYSEPGEKFLGKDFISSSLEGGSDSTRHSLWSRWARMVKTLWIQQTIAHYIKGEVVSAFLLLQNTSVVPWTFTMQFIRRIVLVIDLPLRQLSRTPPWPAAWLLDGGKINDVYDREIIRGDFADDDAVNRKLIRPLVSRNVF